MPVNQNILNLYKILDVDPNASQTEISSAAERLVKQWDPSTIEDRANRAIVAAVLQEIIDARDILMNSRKRKQYDVGIGLADVIYRKNPEKSQADGSHSSRSDVYTNHVSIPHVVKEENESEVTEHLRTLPPKAGMAALKFNLQPRTSSNPDFIYYRTSGNTGSDKQNELLNRSDSKNSNDQSQSEGKRETNNQENGVTILDKPRVSKIKQSKQSNEELKNAERELKSLEQLGSVKLGNAHAPEARKPDNTIPGGSEPIKKNRTQSKYIKLSQSDNISPERSFRGPNSLDEDGSNSDVLRRSVSHQSYLQSGNERNLNDREFKVYLRASKVISNVIRSAKSGGGSKESENGSHLPDLSSPRITKLSDDPKDNQRNSSLISGDTFYGAKINAYKESPSKPKENDNLQSSYRKSHSKEKYKDITSSAEELKESNDSSQSTNSSNTSIVNSLVHIENDRKDLKDESKKNSETKVNSSGESVGISNENNLQAREPSRQNSDYKVKDFSQSPATSDNQFRAKIGERDKKSNVPPEPNLTELKSHFRDKPKDVKAFVASVRDKLTVSASSLSGGSETRTVYSYDSNGEEVEVLVDGKRRIHISKGGSADSYTSDWQDASSSSKCRIYATTVIVANGSKIKTMRICDGSQEIISVYKDHTLLCEISNSVN